jgi:hypothetical protein
VNVKVTVIGHAVELAGLTAIVDAGMDWPGAWVVGNPLKVNEGVLGALAGVTTKTNA